MPEAAPVAAIVVCAEQIRAADHAKVASAVRVTAAALQASHGRGELRRPLQALLHPAPYGGLARTEKLECRPQRLVHGRLPHARHPRAAALSPEVGVRGFEMPPCRRFPSFGRTRELRDA